MIIEGQKRAFLTILDNLTLDFGEFLQFTMEENSEPKKLVKMGVF